MDEVINRLGEPFRVGDRVSFNKGGFEYVIMKLHPPEEGFPFGTWTADDGDDYIPDNLILIERDNNSGWSTL